MNCVFIISNMVSRPKLCVKNYFVGLTSRVNAPNVHFWVLKLVGVWCEVHLLKKTSNCEFQDEIGMWTVTR